MDELQLVSAVRELVNGNDEKPPIPIESVREDYFLHQPQHAALRTDFYTSSFVKGDKWNWHQFVDMAMEPPEKREDMYQRTISLLTDFGNGYKKYFVLNTDSGFYHAPNALSDLNRLKIISEEYFIIYKNIINKIHFDHPNEMQIGRIKGKINWAETIKISNSNFPINFVTSLSKKNFKTPENILLVLCAYWILAESDKLLHINFDNPLTKSSKNILFSIYKKSKFILQKFPFDEILRASKPFRNYSYDPPSNEIKHLESNIKKRILDGTIKNSGYGKLLKWIQKFRDLGVRSFDEQSPTKNIIDSLKNVDTIYEIWIFMEFVTYLKDRGVLLSFELGKVPHCRFYHGSSEITFWYGKNFTRKHGHVWAKHHNPDFIATLRGGPVLGVFDAKNYSAETGRGDSQDKILAYLNNFDTNFGALIYPNYPEDWNRQTTPELESDSHLRIRQNKILNRIFFWDNFDLIDRSTRKSIRKDILLVPWDKLADRYKKLIPRSSEIINQNDSRKKCRFHFDQTVSYLKMNPELTVSSIDVKNKTLDYIFNTIVKGIYSRANVN